MGMKWDEAKETLLRDGFIEFADFRIELTLDNTFLDIDYIPRVAVYYEGDGRWHVLRNPIPKGETLEEGWRNAVEVLERVLRGDVQPDLGSEDVSAEFLRQFRRTFGGQNSYIHHR